MENRNRPFLLPLIQGLPRSISTFDVKVLSAWIAKTVMVGEYLHPQHITIPDHERLRMYADFEPPPNWTIWIADYRGDKWRNLTMFHHMGRLSPVGPSGDVVADAHLTSIGIGRLFIQVAATASGYTIDTDNDAFRRIWPLTGLALSWPPSRFIDDTEADFIANSFARIMKLPRGGAEDM